MTNTSRKQEAMQNDPGKFSSYDGRFRRKLELDDCQAIARNLSRTQGGLGRIEPLPVTVPAYIHACIMHVIRQNMVRNAFDVKEVLGVMRSVGMNRNARLWIAQNRTKYVQGVAFGFRIEENQGGSHDVE